MKDSKVKEGVQRRGFGSQSPERMKEIASSGGHAAHAAGKAHTYTSEEARAAAKLSNEARKRNKKAREEAGRNNRYA